MKINSSSVPSLEDNPYSFHFSTTCKLSLFFYLYLHLEENYSPDYCPICENWTSNLLQNVHGNRVESERQQTRSALVTRVVNSGRVISSKSLTCQWALQMNIADKRGSQMAFPKGSRKCWASSKPILKPTGKYQPSILSFFGFVRIRDIQGDMFWRPSMLDF